LHGAQDYTLIHYDVNAWEGKAYEYGLQWLREAGCPVDGLRFDPDLVIRGLIVDKELGNLVKVDRFGCAPKPLSPKSYMQAIPRSFSALLWTRAWQFCETGLLW
jgi:hypothetical protein